MTPRPKRKTRRKTRENSRGRTLSEDGVTIETNLNSAPAAYLRPL